MLSYVKISPFSIFNCKSKFEPAFRFAEKITKNQGEEGSGTAKKQKKSEKA